MQYITELREGGGGAIGRHNATQCVSELLLGCGVEVGWVGCRLNLQDEAGCKDTKCNSNCPVGDDDTARVLYMVACVCFSDAVMQGGGGAGRRRESVTVSW